MRRLALSGLVALLATPALADPIAGDWLLDDGAVARISACGAEFCITLTNGEFAGTQIGRVRPEGGRYVGTVTDPRDGRDYRGTAVVSGPSMVLEGCALRIFCRSQTWQRM